LPYTRNPTPIDPQISEEMSVPLSNIWFVNGDSLKPFS